MNLTNTVRGVGRPKMGPDPIDTTDPIDTIIAVCHGSMPSMLIRAAYEHFVFPIDNSEIPEGLSKLGCGYVLSLRDKTIEKIEME